MDNAVSSFILYDQPWCGTSPSPAYPLEVYNAANYSGYQCFSSEAMTANISSSCNDQVASVLLRSGWSMRVYRDQNQNGPNACLNNSDPNLSDNTYEDGSPMNNTVSSFVLYEQSDCGQVPPAQPVNPPQPPSGGSCPIPFYWQKDPRWKNHPLRTGGYGNCSSRCNTIGKCGCALTSATMIYDYFGANTTRQGKTMNPANLSDCMGKYACPFTWNTGTRCANNKLSFNWYSFSWSRLERELAKGRLVMLLLQRSNGATHYVVAVSGSGNSPRGYRVHDPALKQGARMRLSDVLKRRDYRIVNMRSYSGTPDCQAVNVSDMNTLEPTFALSAMNPITGSAVIYRNTEITMTFEMAAESINGDITEMLIWTDSISNTIWQPFTEYIAIPLSEQLFVQFRDDAGTVSGVISDFSDPVEGPPDLSLVFLPLILREQ